MHGVTITRFAKDGHGEPWVELAITAEPKRFIQIPEDDLHSLAIAFVEWKGKGN